MLGMFCGALFWRVLEALPLLIFLAYIHTFPPLNRQEWLAPYGLSVVAAAAVSLFLLWRIKTLNAVFFAITLYFVSGFLALLAGVGVINEWYGRLEAVAMILWIIFVAVAGLFVPCKWLSLIHLRDRQRLIIFIAGVSLAAIVAQVFRKVPLIAEFLVFVFIFSLHAVLSSSSRPNERG